MAKTKKSSVKTIKKAKPAAKPVVKAKVAPVKKAAAKKAVVVIKKTAPKVEVKKASSPQKVAIKPTKAAEKETSKKILTQIATPVVKKVDVKDAPKAVETKAKQAAKPATKGKSKNKKADKKSDDFDDDLIDDDFGDSEIAEYEDDLKAVEDEDDDLSEDILEDDESDTRETEVYLTDSEGRRLCRVRDCDQVANVDTYCRYHYLLLWKKIQIRKDILQDGKLEKYIEDLTGRYPDKFLEMIKKDMKTEKDFLSAIQELEIDESALGDMEDNDDDAQSFADEIRGVADAPIIDDDGDY